MPSPAGPFLSLSLCLHGILSLSIATFSVLERLPSSTCRKDRCSVVSDPIQWLWATCGWVFLEVVSSLMEACKSQQQLHGSFALKIRQVRRILGCIRLRPSPVCLQFYYRCQLLGASAICVKGNVRTEYRGLLTFLAFLFIVVFLHIVTVCQVMLC